MKNYNIMLSKPNFFQQPVNQRWQITKKLKAGGFGSVYLAHDVNNRKKEYAIKLMPAQAKNYAQIEQKMYSLIQKQQFTNGFVKHYDIGQFMKSKYLLMELIGKDLDQLKKLRKAERFTLKTVLMIGLQVIDRLQAMHKIGYLHRDVKPDNLAVGLLQKNKIIYMFDFGLALLIGSGIPKQEKGKVVGTLGFMSCRAHQGKPQGPSDDIQSLIYTLIYLVEGTLPWLKLKVQTTPDFHKILLMKRDLPKKHGKGEFCCQQLLQILGMIQQTKADEKVDYLKIKYRLLQALKKRKCENDFAFDWCGNTERLSSPSKEKQERNSLDSPRKNKLKEVMNEQNQQIVQNQIYQVYKFMQENKNKGKKQQQKAAKHSLEKNQLKKNEVNKQKLDDNKQVKKRPASAANIKPQPVLNNWDKIMHFQKSNMISGPKIVINKTAKHKI